jgi:hypothetical protein
MKGGEFSMATEETQVSVEAQTLEVEELPKQLTPERKAYLQAPKGAHRPNRASWLGEALDELLEAIELEAGLEDIEID